MHDPEHLLAAAMEWAAREHANAGRTYGAARLPYSVHLKAVDEVLVWFGHAQDMELRYAARCHDLLEDTNVRLEVVRGLYGPRVLALVQAVTKQPGVSRRAGAEAYYAQIRATPGAVALKVADRIANVAASIDGGSHHLEMYRAEMPGFRAALYVPGTPDEAMWEHLDELFRAAPAATPEGAAPARCEAMQVPAVPHVVPSAGTPVVVEPQAPWF